MEKLRSILHFWYSLNYDSFVTSNHSPCLKGIFLGRERERWLPQGVAQSTRYSFVTNTMQVRDENRHDAQNSKSLHDEVEANRPANVKNLLQRGADVSVTDSSNNTPLHIAAYRKNSHVMQILLEYSRPTIVKRSIDIVNNQGHTALHIAVKENDIKNVRLLLSNGCRYEVRTAAGERAMDLTTQMDVKEILVSVEVDSRLASGGYFARLHERMNKYTKEEIAATTYARDKYGHTSLQRAIQNVHANTAKIITDTRITKLPDAGRKFTEIKELIPPGKQISSIQPSLVMLSLDPENFDIEYMATEIAEILAAAKNIIDIVDNTWMPMDERCSLIEVVRETLDILEFAPNQLIYNASGKITFRGYHPRYYRILKNKDKIRSYMALLQICLTQVMSAFLHDVFGVHLVLAAKNHDLELFRSCIEEQQIDVNMITADKKSCLHYAADHGSEEMVNLLLKEKANVMLQENQDGQTALHIAAAKGYNAITKAILESVSSTECNTLMDVKTGDKDWTALHFAAASGNSTTVLLLWQYGAKYDLPSRFGELPKSVTKNPITRALFTVADELFALAENGNDILPQHLTHMQRDELMAIGNMRSSKGKTLAQTATLNGHYKIAEAVSEIIQNTAPSTSKKEVSEDTDMNQIYYMIEGYQLLNTLLSMRT